MERTDMIDGNTLIAWGFTPGAYFKYGIGLANRMRTAGHDDDAIFVELQKLVPIETQLRTNNIPYGWFLDAETELERENARAVAATMDELMRTPTIVAGAVMPDACPAGTIPVGGAVACEDAIHPGFHSSDICCSMAMSVFRRNDDPKRILDAVQKWTHFGPGGRQHTVIEKSSEILKAIGDNHFLKDLGNFAIYHFATQGDGNHFAYVGHLRSTGQPALVTHHGSRGLGAQLYKKGMVVAQRHTSIVAPKVPKHNAWIKASSRDGESYWEALQLVREWTRDSHFAIHILAAKELGNRIEDVIFNEHNFVFQKSDGLFYHGKGATPSWKGFDRTLIPMNMAEPILIAAPRDRKDALGFAPHGAGRNTSRTVHLKSGGLEEELANLKIDARSYSGTPDFSELPSAYKNAAAVQAQIAKYGLAEVVDYVDPYGSIMAGESPQPWRKK
jgi:RNA-splicing ligase RtcB